MYKIDEIITARPVPGGGSAQWFAISGVLTPGTLPSLASQLGGLLRGASPIVCVADYRATIMAVTAEEMHALFTAHLRQSFEVPAAQIVCQADAKMMRHHAWMAAQAGILRRVFTNELSAARWAQQEVALAQSRIAR